MRSGWSVGILMIAMGGLSLGGFGAQIPPTHAGYAISGALIAAGALLFLRRAIAWWCALVATLVMTVSGFAAQAGRPQWGLPVPPMLAIAVGLYILLRLFIARGYFIEAPSPKERE